MTDQGRVVVGGHGYEYDISVDSAVDAYPKSHSYEWQEFAGLAVELGGYSDLTLINPYTGQRLWVAGALRQEEAESPTYLINGLRRALDVAEAVGFFAK